MGLIAYSCPTLHNIKIGWVRQFDGLGQNMGRVRTCNYY
jgi:hypothetical protein